MLSQAYSLSNLKAMVKRREPYRFKIKNKKHLNSELENVVNELNQGTFAYKRLSVHHTKRGDVFSTKDFGSLIVQRKLNYNLTRLYKVKQSNRQLIIRQIRALLEEPVPKHIIKLDISKFYESINRNTVLDKVRRDPILSLSSKHPLTILYSDNYFSCINGFPRGISTSATLTELHLRDFDKAITSLHGVYFYTRYVDDIIIFSFLDPRPILDSVKEILALKYGLFLNEAKTQVFSIRSCVCGEKCHCKKPKCQCENQCACRAEFKKYREKALFPSKQAPSDKREFIHLDYLGYRFSFPPIVRP